MNADWNWYFSALAQSSAALIAIIAAFTISKLLSESEKVEDHSNAINEVQLNRTDLMRKIQNRHFEWHDEKIIEYSYDLKDAIENGEFNNLTNEDCLIKLHKLEPDLYGVENCIKYLTERIREVKSNKRQPSTGALSFLEQPILPNLKFVPPGLWDSLREEREKINELKLESVKVIDWFNSKKIEINSRSRNTDPLKHTIFILIFGLLATVIYPLHFLPLEINQTPIVGFSIEIILNNIFSIRGILLTLLGITIIGLFVYFLSIVFKIEKLYKSLDSSIGIKELDISIYSKFFKNNSYNESK